MAQKIQLKRSSVTGNVPTTAQLDLGEIAINTYDGKVFIKKDDGTESIVEVTGSTGGISQTIIDSTVYATLEELLDSQILTALATDEHIVSKGYIDTVTEADVTQHEAALTITQSQISDFAETDPVFTASAASGITAQNITDWQDAADNYTTLAEVGAATGDMTGWPNRTDTTISFDDGTRTFTIEPSGASASYWYKGVESTFTTAKTFQIPDTSGAIYINMDANGDLYNAGTHGDIRAGLLCGYVYWDAVNQTAMVFGDERHSALRDTEWHYNQHRNLGAVWRSGGALTYTLNDDSAVSLSVGDVTIADEDLEHVIIHAASPANPYEQVLTGAANIPTVAYIGTAWQQIAPSTVPWVPGDSSLAKYNPITGGVGAYADATDDTYLSYWLFATNDSVYPVKLAMGRVLHASVDEAFGEEFDSYGINMAEMAPLYHIVLHVNATYTNNAANVRLAAVRIITERKNTASTAFSAASHESLTNRTAADSHPISAITGLQTALDGKEPSITKSTGYARWTGSAFAFDNVSIPQVLTDLGIADGTADQVLVTDGAGNFSFDSIKIPAGGEAGATLVKNSAADYDVIWEVPPALDPGLYGPIVQVSGENAVWTNHVPDISAYAGLDVRLVIQSVNGGGFAADTQIDNINFDGTTYGFEGVTHSWQTSAGNSYTNFQSVVWVAMAVENNNAGLWQVTSGNTPSNNTGNLGAQTGTGFMYVESSNPASATGYTIWARSPVVTLSANPTLSLWEGREGGDIGTVAVYIEVV